MKVQRITVRKALAALITGIGSAAVVVPRFTQSGADYPPMMGGYGPGYGMGPGMMGGYGPGYGRGYGPGYGMGPGMMGGYGMGPGMMGGYGPGYGMGYGMGPWMMGGYGRGYGMGYGMGPWMMGGYGPGYHMGPGMWGGYEYNALDLSDAQRAKIQKIQEEAWNSQWEVMNKMHEAISQGWVEAQKKIDAVLTKKQREQLRQGWGAQQ